MKAFAILAYLVAIACLALALRKSWRDSKAAERRALELLDASDEYGKSVTRANETETLRGIAMRRVRDLPRRGT